MININYQIKANMQPNGPIQIIVFYLASNLLQTVRWSIPCLRLTENRQATP